MSDGPSQLRSQSRLSSLGPGAYVQSQKQKHTLRGMSHTGSHAHTVAESHMQKAEFIPCSFLLLCVYGPLCPRYAFTLFFCDSRSLRTVLCPSGAGQLLPSAWECQGKCYIPPTSLGNWAGESLPHQPQRSWNSLPYQTQNPWGKAFISPTNWPWGSKVRMGLTKLGTPGARLS